MAPKPYVGITGAASQKEVETTIAEFEAAGFNMESDHIPMLGILVSYKTLNRQPTENKRYPKIEKVMELLIAANDSALTMLHYNSREKDTLAEQIDSLFQSFYQMSLCKAIQLNIPWPDPGQISKIKERYAELKIVFQASQSVLEGSTAREIAEDIRDKYCDAISYILIGPSGGKGAEFDVQRSLAIYSELREKMPDVTVGFAGGFTGNNVEERVKKLIEATNETGFCIDAEGGLRDKLSDNYGDDTYNQQKAREYLQGAARGLTNKI